MEKTKNLPKVTQNRADFSKNWKLLLKQLETDRSTNLSSKFERSSVTDVDNLAKQGRRRSKKKKRAKKAGVKSSDCLEIAQQDANEKATTSLNSKSSNGVMTNSSDVDDVDDQNSVKNNVVSYAGVVKQSLHLHPNVGNPPKTQNKATRLTKCLAIDCEFVGVGEDGTDDMVARVSLVNLFGDCVYDKYVQAEEEIVDYRTRYSGIRRENLINATDLRTVQKEVSDMIKGRILIGHSVHKDLKVLFLSHPKKDLRDTSTHKACRSVAKTNRPSLKKLALLVLGIVIQEGEHNSVTDARVAMQLYRTFRQKWEASCQRQSYRRKCQNYK